MARRYWLFKTEPTTFSIDDLLTAPKQTACWDGVRNFKARNYLRDEVRKGDHVFIYHSSTDEPAVMGVAEVVAEGYPDHTAFDPKHDHYDEKSDRANPTWFMVDVRAVKRLKRPVTLAEMRDAPALSDMGLLKRGNRLSIQAVTELEFREVLRMAGE